jgi:hypothetical protein
MNRFRRELGVLSSRLHHNQNHNSQISIHPSSQSNPKHNNQPQPNKNHNPHHKSQRRIWIRDTRMLLKVQKRSLRNIKWKIQVVRVETLIKTQNHNRKRMRICRNWRSNTRMDTFIEDKVYLHKQEVDSEF